MRQSLRQPGLYFTEPSMQKAFEPLVALDRPAECLREAARPRPLTFFQAGILGLRARAVATSGRSGDCATRQSARPTHSPACRRGHHHDRMPPRSKRLSPSMNTRALPVPPPQCAAFAKRFESERLAEPHKAPGKQHSRSKPPEHAFRRLLHVITRVAARLFGRRTVNHARRD